MKTIKITPLTNPVKKTVDIPGSKSYTNRALLLGALTRGRVEIINPLFSDDTKSMIDCLVTLGIKVIKTKNRIDVVGSIDDIKDKTYTLNAGLSGTAIRFVTALSAVTPGTKLITGEDGLLKRPIKDLADALSQIGVNIVYTGKEGFPPIRIWKKAQNQEKTNIKINGNISSQFLSSILMIAPLLERTKITVSQELASKPYIEMTLEIMEKFGVKVENKNFKNFEIRHCEYKCDKYIVEPDFSSACYFAAIAALTKSTITLKNISSKSKQADRNFFEIIKIMGNKIIEDNKGLTIIGKGIKPVKINMKDCPDQIQTLSVLCSFANGKTEISGIQTLRVKETNRVDALKKELAKMGIKTQSTENALVIYGGNPKPAVIDTFGDHRMAMSFAVAGSLLDGISINNPDVVTKTFPNFWRKMKELGIKISDLNPVQKVQEQEKNLNSKKIILIGFMGAGKSSVAPLLAKKLRLTHLEMDEMIIKKSGKKSVEEIFTKFGEFGGKNSFRSLELEIGKNMKNKQDVVISAGGGVVMNEELMKSLTHKGTTVFLQTSFETIQKRLTDISNRPLWKDLKKTKKLFDERLSLYEQFADIVISTDGKSLGMVTEEIVRNIL